MKKKLTILITLAVLSSSSYAALIGVTNGSDEMLLSTTTLPTLIVQDYEITSDTYPAIAFLLAESDCKYPEAAKQDSSILAAETYSEKLGISITSEEVILAIRDLKEKRPEYTIDFKFDADPMLAVIAQKLGSNFDTIKKIHDKINSELKTSEINFNSIEAHFESTKEVSSFKSNNRTYCEPTIITKEVSAQVSPEDTSFEPSQELEVIYLEDIEEDFMFDFDLDDNLESDTANLNKFDPTNMVQEH